MTTFDFSTLYTKIPHDKLSYVLNTLIDFCFDGGSSDFITVNRFGANWVENPSEYRSTFTRQSIKEAVRFLMYNCYLHLEIKYFNK